MNTQILISMISVVIALISLTIAIYLKYMLEKQREENERELEAIRYGSE